MKAEEVQRRYAAGERNFSGANLRGQNFKGQTLSGANFSHADIRGANFTAANLSGANFTGAKAGLRRSSVHYLISVSFLLALLSGFFAWAVEGRNFILIIFTLILLIVGLLLLYLTELDRNWKTSMLYVALIGGLVGFLAQLGIGSLFIQSFGCISAAMAIAAAGLEVGNLVLARNSILIMIASSVVLVIANVHFTVWSTTMAVMLIGTCLGCWLLVKGQSILPPAHEGAIGLATALGTSFRSANLTGANFKAAVLKSSDFRKATLNTVNWFQTTGLDFARPGNSYLQHPQVRQLVQTLQGQDQKFDRLNLSGINLQGANLQDASFVSSDLNDANLQDANLSRANLKQTQLDRADLTGACLTGAYIEDWGITNETKLDGVRCEYVFMRVPTKANPDPLRKPDNHRERFEDGDFADFIKPLFDTLDLYHNQDVDPRSIALAFKDLASNHSDAELRVVAMEAKGDDKFLLRVKTAEAANKSKLSAEYFDRYNFYKTLPANDLRLLLAERDDRVRSLENMIGTALNQPNFHIQGDYMPENNISSGSGSFINTGDITGSTINLGQISGTVTNAIGQLPSSPEGDRLKDLLIELQAAIETDPQLPDDDKQTALEQVKELAAAGQEPDVEKKRSIGKRATQMLKGIAASLPDATSLVEACAKLLPLITPLIGL